jgi:AraC-like DNA-binding protein
MASSIPLIRASAIIGLEDWLLAAGRPAAEILSAAGLPPSPRAAPARLASFHALFDLLARLAETEGPEFSARIATPEALMMLGAPATAVRSSQTVREALHKVARTFHNHVSQAFFLVENVPGGLEVVSSIPIDAPVEMHHQAYQQIARFVRCIGEAAGLGPLPCRIRIVGHPRHGVAHLMPLLGDELVAHGTRHLRMFIPDTAADAQLHWGPDDAGCGEETLRRVGCATLSDSARVLIAGMVEDGNPSLDRLAMLAGRSRRTMQRLLGAEGASFVDLLDEVRRDLALSRLTGSEVPVAEIAGDVGYKTPSSLSRAVRRWTESNPRRLRRTPPA